MCQNARVGLEVTQLILWQRLITDCFTSCSCIVVTKCPGGNSRSKEWQVWYMYISALCMCVGVCTSMYVSECATLRGVHNIPWIALRWSAPSQSETKDSINPIISHLSLLKCAVAYRSFDVYLGTSVGSQGCVGRYLFLEAIGSARLQKKRLPKLIVADN